MINWPASQVLRGQREKKERGEREDGSEREGKREGKERGEMLIFYSKLCGEDQCVRQGGDDDVLFMQLCQHLWSTWIQTSDDFGDVLMLRYKENRRGESGIVREIEEDREGIRMLYW